MAKSISVAIHLSIFTPAMRDIITLPLRYTPDKGGSLTVSGNLMVSNIDSNNDNVTLSSAEDRVKTLTTVDDYEAQPVAHKARIEPCTHGSYTYTIKDNNQHTARCGYCGYETVENHAATGTCDCGYYTGVAVYDVTLNTCDGQSGLTYNEQTQAKVAKDKSYILPECLLVPKDYEFIGWVETTDGSSIMQQEGETLRQPGYKITVTANATYYARYKMTDITLADAAENGATIRNYDDCPVHSVTLADRTLTKDGKWNTLCLPFDVTIANSPLAGDNVVAKVFDSTSNLDGDGKLTLKFSDAPATITAGTPFIIKWDNTGVNLVNPVFNGVTISSTPAQEVESTDGNVKFVGQYSPFNIDNNNINEILYVASGNKIGYSKNPRTLKSCRAHFWVKPNVGGTPSARAINIDWDNDATAIESIDNGQLIMDNEATAQWYSFDGRRLSGKPTAKGVYISNGRKMIIK